MERVKLIQITDPLNPIGSKQTRTIDYKGESILSIRNKVAPQDVDFIISINGRIIPKEEWGGTFLIPGDMVLLKPVLEGGGSGGVLRMVAMIALVIIATYITGPAGGLLAAGPAFGSTTAYAFGYYLAVLATMAVGGMLINSLLPVETAKANNGEEASNTYSWNPSTLQQQGINIPKIYGKLRVYGNVIAANTESYDDKNYLNTLICLGHGPYKSIGYDSDDSTIDMWVNDQPISNFSNVTVYTRNGKLSQDVVPNFNDTIVEESLSAKITSGSSHTFTTTVGDFDELEVELGFPKGIYYSNDKGNFIQHNITIKIEYKLHSETTWNTALDSRHVYINMFRRGSKWSYGHFSGSNWVEIEAGSSAWADHYQGETKTLSNGLPDYPNSWQFRYTRWREPIYIPNAVVCDSKSAPLNKRFKVAKSLPHGVYDVRVTKISPDYNSRWGDDVYFTKVKEIYYDDFSYPRCALVGLRALATDQLSGSLRFSCIVEGAYVRVYNGATWSIAYSTNPAWVCYDVLTQPVFDDSLTTVLRYDGINPSFIDHDSFKVWADFCDELVNNGAGGTEKRFTFNGVFDTQRSLWESALKVGTMARGLLLFQGFKITVVVDKASNPGQLFTDGNIEKDSFKEIFLSLDERAGEVEINFNNEELNFERDTLSVYNTSLDSNNKVTLDYLGVTKASQAWRCLEYQLACNLYLKRVVEWKAHIDAIACTVGDVVNFAHSVPEWGVASGRIVSATSHNTEVTINNFTCNLSVVSDNAFITNPSSDLTSYIGNHITLTDTNGKTITGWIKEAGTTGTASGSSTKDNTRLSIASNTAFVDLTGVDLSPYCDGKHQIVITDSAGKKLIGWIKEAGTTGTASGPSTYANTKISFVNSTAFVDLTGVDLSSYCDGKHQIVITDSAGKTIKGYLKAAGSGVTYGDNIGNGDLETWTDASTPGTWSHAHAGSSTVNRDSSDKHGGNYSCRLDCVSGDTTYIYQTIYWGAGKLYDYSLWAKVSDGAKNGKIYTYNTAETFFGATRIMPNQTSYTQYSGHRVATSNDNAIWIARESTTGSYSIHIDDIVIRQILSPSTTGAWISSAPDGTQGGAWTEEQSGFNRNDASGYTYQILAGVTYGPELISNGGFDTTTNWSVAGDGSSIASISGGQSGNCLELTGPLAGNPYAHQSEDIASGALYEFNGYVKDGSVSGQTYWAGLYRTGHYMIQKTGTTSSSWTAMGAQRVTGTQDASYIWYYQKMGGAAGTILADSLSGKQILTPSATGATIVSSPNGTSYNWTEEESGFNRNDASGYTYQVLAGETYGANLLTNPNFDTTYTGWEVGYSALCSIEGSGQSGNCLKITENGHDSPYVYEYLTVIPKKLYKSGVYYKAGTWNRVLWYGNDGIGTTHGDAHINVPATWTLDEWYRCIWQGYASGYYIAAMAYQAPLGGAGSVYFDSAYFREVLTPSSTGVRIVSESGGLSYNWTSEDADFNQNATSYTAFISDLQTNSVTLDQEVTLENGKTYEVMVRLDDDTLVTKSVTNSAGNYTTLTLSTPWASLPTQYCPYAVGESNYVTKPIRVLDIQRDSDLTATIRGIEYNASMYNVDTGTPAIPTYNYSNIDVLPSVTNLVVNELNVKGLDGAATNLLRITFDLPISYSIKSYIIMYKENSGAWINAGETLTGTFDIKNVNIGVNYTVAVCSKNYLGNVQSPDVASSVAIYTVGLLAPPSNVTGFVAKQNGNYVKFVWTPISDVDVWGYEIREGLTWDGARVLVSGVQEGTYDWQPEIDGTFRFWIKAMDESGMYSNTGTSSDLTLSGIADTVNIILTQDEVTKGGGPDGTAVNFVFVPTPTPFLTIPHTLTDTIVSSLTDISWGISAYEGDQILTASYTTNAIDISTSSSVFTRLLANIDAYDTGATDLSYSSRVDTTFSIDTDTHVSTTTTYDIFVCYSDDDVTYTDWEKYIGVVQYSYRYIKVKLEVSATSISTVLDVYHLIASLDVPESSFDINNLSVSATTGTTVSFSTYSKTFFTTPAIIATVVGATKNIVPVISSKTNTGFIIKLYDKTDAVVAGTVDVKVIGY